MKFGYARVSTEDQNLSLQFDALNHAGCEDITSEKISTHIADRPVWASLVGKLRSGDQVVVYKLDRIARSTSELLKTVEQFSTMKVDLISIQEPWVNTNTAAGKMIITVMAGIAEFERDLIRQRTHDGRVAAQKRGVQFGRPKKLNGKQIQLIKTGRQHGASVTELASAFNVSKDTIYRVVKISGN